MSRGYWGPEEHGLGNRKIARDKVEALEQAILTAVQVSESLRIKWERFLELCEAAVDTHPSLRRRV
jgi:hypothetical protein